MLAAKFRCFTLFSLSLVITSNPALAKEIWKGNSSNITMTWTDSDIKAERGGKTIFSYLQNYEKEQDCEDKQSSLGTDDTTRITVRSLFGTFLGYKLETSGYGGGAHPYQWSKLYTVDLTNGHELTLTDLYTDQELLNALLQDPFIRRGLSARHGESQKFQTTQQFFDFFLHHNAQKNEPEDPTAKYGIYKFIFESFVFSDVKSDKVAVRIGLSHDSEMDRGAYTELGLWLPIPKKFEDDLQKARKKISGFLMTNGPKGTTKFIKECPPSKPQDD